VPTDPVAPPWAIRSSLVAVADLDRSVAFYGELGPFAVIAREDAVAVLGEPSPPSIALILRESQGTHQIRHGQQSLGLRSITFNVGLPDELDRIEALLRNRDLFTVRRHIAKSANELVLGRDPDNLPLAFICYAESALGPEYYRAVVDLVYSMDV
jgi:hypothetical protein